MVYYLILKSGINILGRAVEELYESIILSDVFVLKETGVAYTLNVLPLPEQDAYIEFAYKDILKCVNETVMPELKDIYDDLINNLEGPLLA